jgi:hypothetical protein
MIPSTNSGACGGRETYIEEIAGVGRALGFAVLSELT